MKLIFLGATHEVTGSCTLLEACGKKILIDCGMEQGPDTYENCEIPVLPGDIDAICLTHAHMDHSGKIPALVAKGFAGPIYATEATQKLCGIMLRDSAHIQEFEAEWRNRKAKRAGEPPYVPLYTMADAERTINQFDSYPYGQEIQIFDGITLRFADAGHLLGSASIYITVTEDGETRSLLFSGDLGNIDRPLIRDPQPAEYADYVIVESTYGDRLHGERPDYLAQLTTVLQETFDRGGNVVIPSFAIGRTQELLYLLRTIKEEGRVRGYDGFPVYVDSPLAVEATRIYSCGMTDYYDAETLDLLEKGIDPIVFPDLRLSVTSDESKLINFDMTPKVILSASGMCEAGRIRHHLKHNLWDPKNSIVFVGYQAEGTLGRALIDGVKEVKLFGETVIVAAEIHNLEGFSGHADQNGLLDWLGGFQKIPKQIFLVHGEEQSKIDFAKAAQERLGLSTTPVFANSEFELETGELIAKDEVIKEVIDEEGLTNLRSKIADIQKGVDNILGQTDSALSKEMSADKLTQINNILQELEKVSLNLGSTVTKG